MYTRNVADFFDPNQDLVSRGIPVTYAQIRALEMWIKLEKKFGYPPITTELARHVSVHPNTVRRWVVEWEEAEIIKRNPKHTRYMITDYGRQLMADMLAVEAAWDQYVQKRDELVRSHTELANARETADTRLSG